MTENTDGIWSLYDRSVFIIASVSDKTKFNNVEYFFDADPGIGNDTFDIEYNSGTITQTFSIPTTNLERGIHVLYVRTQNSEGQWSLYDRTLFLISDFSDDDEPITAAEYFFDDANPSVWRWNSVNP